MTDWDAIAEQGKEPDTLEKVIKTLAGAILPMAQAMDSPPMDAQIKSLTDELEALYERAYALKAKAIFIDEIRRVRVWMDIITGLRFAILRFETEVAHGD